GAGRFTMYNDGESSYSTFTKYGKNRSGGYAGIPTLYPYANLLAFGNNGIASGDGLGRFLISSGGNIGISLFKSGSSKLKFHADFDSENVGIGGSSVPVSRVHLNNTDGTLMDLRLTNNTSGHTATDGLVISQTGNVATIMNNENSSLILGTNNNNQITITNGGAVGVGTTTPTTKLDVNGQIRMQGGSPGAGKLMTSDANGVGSWSTAAGAGLVSGSGTNNYVPKFTNANTIGNSHIYALSDAVGIGTTSPGAKVHVRGTDGNYLYGLFENGSTSGDRSALIGVRSCAPAKNNTLYYGVGGTGNGLSQTANQFYIENVGKGVRFSIDTFGRAKIGNLSSPYSTLNIGGNSSYDTASVSFQTGGELFNIRLNASGQMEFVPNNSTPTGTAAMTIDDENGGRVAIGTVASMPTGYKLYVKDGILTERLKVAVNGSGNWADYVFAEDYNLLPLDHVEAFIKENKHLPNVPSAEAMAENGLDVATMDAKLMEKIEELTLYLIEMKKEIKSLKAENETIKANLKK
ncbi:MAG: hypothetical protein IT215_00035, partial [Chitinophagaceae bacterium]|nr:hypothetical protein [Chitinophagaceae bacterium]